MTPNEYFYVIFSLNMVIFLTIFLQAAPGTLKHPEHRRSPLTGYGWHLLAGYGRHDDGLRGVIIPKVGLYVLKTREKSHNILISKGNYSEYTI